MATETLCACGCGQALPAGINRGKPRRFVSESHRRHWWTVARKQGVDLLRHQVPPHRKRLGSPILLIQLTPSGRLHLLLEAASDVLLRQEQVTRN